MFAKVMFVDSTTNPTDELQSTDVDAWESQVSEAIGSLDGCRVRLVGFGQRPPAGDSGCPFGGLGILIGGGGAAGVYVVAVFKEYEDDTAYLLRKDETPNSSSMAEVMFGQMTSFDERFCVDLSDALETTKSFVSTGTIDFARWRFAIGPISAERRQQAIVRSWFTRD